MVRQLFGSSAVPVVERSVEAAQTPAGQLAVKTVKVVGAVAALAVLFASVDLRS